MRKRPSAEEFGDLILSYSSGEPVTSYEAYPPQAAQHWSVLVEAPASEPHVVEYGVDADEIFRSNEPAVSSPPPVVSSPPPVAVFNFVKIGNTSGRALLQLADAESEIDHALTAIFDFDTGDLNKHLENQLTLTGEPWVLIATGMRLHPDWRGCGIGRYLAARAIDFLASDCRLVAIHPGPFSSQRDELSEEDQAKVTKKLASVWRSIGFRNYKDGVMVLDPNLVTLDNWMRRFEQRHGFSRFSRHRA